MRASHGRADGSGAGRRSGLAGPASVGAGRRHGLAGQASILIVGGLAGVLVAALILGVVARAVGREGAAQRAADLAALAGARVMHANYMRLFEPARIGRRRNPAHLEKAAYLALARAEAERVARANDAGSATVSFPDGATIAPVRVHVGIAQTVAIHRGRVRRTVAVRAQAEAELSPPGADGLPPGAEGDGYTGPFAYRQGKPMRPDVALAFDRMAGAARAAGLTLTIASAYRSDAEQAELFRRHPDPKWVAPPGKSLHRYATELDLGPASAYAWLAANAGRFHFRKRYAWEPWHQETPLALNEQATAARIAIIGMREQAHDGEAVAGRPHRDPARCCAGRPIRWCPSAAAWPGA